MAAVADNRKVEAGDNQEDNIAPNSNVPGQTHLRVHTDEMQPESQRSCHRPALSSYRRFQDGDGMNT
jgi:hypothetical protein